MADFAEHTGIDQVIAVDLHSPQVEGVFHVPVENLTAVFALAEALKPRLKPGSVIVSPDAGGVKLASAYASRLGCPVAVLHKERLNGTETVVSRVVGEVRGRPCVIVDDMISTGGTIKSVIETSIQAGSRENFIIAATHPVFTPEARKNLKSIGQIIVTSSIPFSADDWPNVQTVSLAPLLAAAIRRSTAGESMANLFQGVIHGGE